jgi:hypothetical protein
VGLEELVDDVQDLALGRVLALHGAAPFDPLLRRERVVPVDFVVGALDHIAHKRGLDGQCFHLTDPEPKRVGDILNIFAKAAHAPIMSVRINALLFSFIPNSVKKGMMALTPVRRIRDQLMKNLALPPNVMQFVNYPTRFDCRETLKALQGSGIACPPLDSYAWRLWDYWERHLDPTCSSTIRSRAR